MGTSISGNQCADTRLSRVGNRSRINDEGSVATREVYAEQQSRIIQRMFKWLKEKFSPGAASSSIRETLFGDMPLAEWARAEHVGSPWTQFGDVQRCLQAKDRRGAISALEAIVALPDLEPRHYLQAWNELRVLGIRPTADAKRLLGVVVEVHLPQGLDILAAYTDHSARYFNFSGAAVVWERPDDSLDQRIDVLSSCRPN